MFYHWLGWISFAMCVFLLAKYIGRISNNKSINRWLRRFHKPVGIAVIGVGFIHGIISFIKKPEEVVGIFSGVFLWVLIVFLAQTYYARVRLKSKWFNRHRHLAIFLMIILAIHIALVI